MQKSIETIKNLIKKEQKELLNKKANNKLIKSSDTSTISILKTLMELKSFNLNRLKERKESFVEWICAKNLNNKNLFINTFSTI
jgi:hypothetical protein